MDDLTYNPAAVNVADSLLGQVLADNYRLDEVINRGAMSVVYRGTNLKTQAPLVLKVIASSITDNTALMARFRVEAELQIKLDHPNVVRVCDYISEGLIQAIVMEHIAGLPLEEILYDLDQPMSTARIKQLMLPVLDVLQYAHGQGVIHRDLKPSNILITRDADREFPKVMDFGIAKVLAETAVNTAPGVMIGTLLYMSPEQCKALKTVDHRTDIYSLGITLYQMATGMVPFYAESAFDIMLAHVQSPPTPPHEIAASVAPEVEALILKAIAKDPADRWQSAQELADALRAIPEGQSPSYPANLAGAVTIPDSEPPATEPAAAEPPRQPATPTEEPRPRRDSDVSGDVTKRMPPAAKYTQASAAGASPASRAKRLQLIIPDKEDWMQHFDVNAAGGGLFCPTPDPPHVGTPVRLEVIFVGGPRVLVHGIVTWRRTQLNDPRVRAGVGLQVHPGDSGKLGYINAWARGDAKDQRRRRRLPVRLQVIYSAKSGRRINFTRDINRDGVFIRSRELLEPQTSIQLALIPPGGGKPHALVGKVARVVEAPDERGMGIAIEWSSPAAAQEFSQFLKQLEEQLLAGNLPEDVLS